MIFKAYEIKKLNLSKTQIILLYGKNDGQKKEVIEKLIYKKNYSYYEQNEILEKAGFGKNFYKLYKVKDSDKAEKYRYFLISNYTSDKHYKMTHDVSKELDDLNNDFWNSDLAPIFEDDENHIYRRVYRIDQ